MSEFGTKATLELAVPDRELKKVKSKIEASVAETPVSIEAATPGGGSTGGDVAARDRARQRQLLTEGLDLDERRNELLERLLEVNEEGNFTRARGGGGGLGLLAGGIGLVGGALAGLAGAVSNFNLSPPNITPDDVVGAAVDLAAADVVSPVALTPPDVVTPAAVAASDLVDSGAAITTAALVGSPAAVTASALVGATADIRAEDVIGEPYGVAAADVIESAVSLATGDIVGAAVELGVGDIIGDAVDISAQDLLKAAGIAGGVGAGAAAASQLSKGGGAAAGSPGLGFPLPAVGLGRAAKRAEDKRPNERNIVDRILSGLTPDVNPNRQQALTASQNRRSRGFESKGRARPINVSVDARSEGVSRREVERIAQRHADNIGQDIRQLIQRGTR